MSLTGDRDAIAAALSGVPGVTGYPYRPSTPRAGDAWPLLGAIDRAEAMTFYVNWRILVFLPQSERGASDFIDARWEDLVDALLPVGFVERIEPVALGPAGAEQFAAQILMRSE